MTEVSAQVTVILSRRCVPTGPGSRYIPPRSRSPSICSLCSQDPHSCPSRAPTVQPRRSPVTPDYSRGEKPCVNVSLSNPSSLFPVVQIFHCVWNSLFLSLGPLICSPSLVSVCVCNSLSLFMPLLCLYTSSLGLNPPHMEYIGAVLLWVKISTCQDPISGNIFLLGQNR